MKIEKETETVNRLGKPSNFMLNMLCCFFIYPAVCSLIYQSLSMWGITLVYFFLYIPLALGVGGFVINTTWVFLNSTEIPHSKYPMLDGAIFATLISILFTMMISHSSLKFGLSIVITGSIVGLLIPVFAEPIIERRKEQ